LFALLDEVARATGSQPPDLVLVSADFNASVDRAGLRRRLVLTVGLPLWEALDDPQRVAVLGHELGHEVNGDPRSTLLIGTAVESLHRWAWLLLPDTRAPRQRRRFGARGGSGSLLAVAEHLVPIVLLPLSVTVGLLALGLQRIGARSGQRAEYRADELAAGAAGTDSAVSLLDHFFLAEQCINAMQLAVSVDRDADVWAAERRFLRAVTPAQRERWRRIAAREQHRTDASHPPTLLRREMLLSRPMVTGSVHVTPAMLASANDELVAFEPAVARMLRDGRTES
jgi:Zn-dependent protease with chaperone function